MGGESNETWVFSLRHSHLRKQNTCSIFQLKFGLQFGSDPQGQVLSHPKKSVLLFYCHTTFWVQNNITQGDHSSYRQDLASNSFRPSKDFNSSPSKTLKRMYHCFWNVFSSAHPRGCSEYDQTHTSYTQNLKPTAVSENGYERLGSYLREALKNMREDKRKSEGRRGKKNWCRN